MRSDARRRGVLWFVVVVLGVGVLMYGCGGGEEPEMPAATPEVSAPLEEAAPVEQAAEPSVVEGEVLIVPKVGVGEVEFGMTLDEVKEVWGEPEGPPRGEMYDYFSKGVTLSTLGQSGVVWQIFCLSTPEGAPEDIGHWDFKGRTAEGIGIGSTEAEVVSAYGEPTKRESGGEGATLLRYENMQTLFMLGGGSVLSIWLVDDTQLRRK